MIILHIHIYPTSDQEAIDVVNELNRIYPEAKKNAEGNVACYFLEYKMQVFRTAFCSEETASEG